MPGSPRARTCSRPPNGPTSAREPVRSPVIRQGFCTFPDTASHTLISSQKARLTIPVVAVEDWLFDAMAALDTDLEDLEPEPDDEDDGLA